MSQVVITTQLTAGLESRTCLLSISEHMSLTEPGWGGRGLPACPATQLTTVWLCHSLCQCACVD